MLRRFLKFAVRLGVVVALSALVIKLLDDRDQAAAPAPNVEPPRPPRPTPRPIVAEPEPAKREPLRAELIEETPPVKANRQVPVDAKPADKRAAMVSWVEPHGTVCPASHPIKAKLGSKVFRRPDSPGYDASKPDRCYASESAAKRAGFREAQR